MRRLVLAAGLLAALAAGPVAVWAGPLAGPLVEVSGTSPFAGCTADLVPGNVGTNFPESEVEPWVDVNPINTGNIVGSWQQDRWSNGGAKGLVAAFTRDGGEHWFSRVIPGLTLCSGGSFQRASDPWLSFAPNGDLYHVAIGVDFSAGARFPGALGRNAILVSKSIDGGDHWSAPVTLIEDTNPRFFNDKESITADPADARLVYVVWDRTETPNGFNINPEHVFGNGFKGPAYFSRTTDGGRTWEPARAITRANANAQTIANQIVVLPDGTLVDAFNYIVTLTELASPPDAQGRDTWDFTLGLVRSTDQGATWSRLIRGPKILTMARLDPGQTGVRDPDDFPDPVNGSPHARIRTGDIVPEIAVDRNPASPGYGNLYAVWQDARFNGFQYDEVAFSMSEDGGLTWSAPVRISTPRGVPAFTPAIKVAADGAIGILYYDFRNNTPDPSRLETDAWLVRFRVDLDGTVTGREEARVTPSSFDMLKAPFARGFFLGDYIGLTAVGDDFEAFFTRTTASDPAQIVFSSVGP